MWSFLSTLKFFYLLLFYWYSCFYFGGADYVCFTVLCFCCTGKSISYVCVCVCVCVCILYIFPPSWTCFPFPFTTGSLDVSYLCPGQAWIPVPYYCRKGYSSSLTQENKLFFLLSFSVFAFPEIFPRVLFLFITKLHQLVFSLFFLALSYLSYSILLFPSFTHKDTFAAYVSWFSTNINLLIVIP